MSTAVPCPSDDQLIALLEGALSVDEAASLDVHLDDCASCAETTAVLASLRPVPTRQVHRYVIGEPLGAGGMGEVFRARDPELERDVAIKFIRPEFSDGDAARARLIREARSLARVTHPNVIVVHDVGEQGGEIFIVTELVDGETMGQWQRGRSWRELASAYAQAARGLAAAHAAGLVHRDIKPSNLLRGRDGRVRVCDFGLARPDDTNSVQSNLTDGRVVGTPAYMAPEQRLGMTADARADQFSLCLALAEALIGSRPLPDSSAEQLVRDGAPANVAAVLARGLRLSPDERFADLAAVAAALDGCLVETQAQTQTQAQPKPRSKRTMLAVVALATASVAIGMSIALTRHDAPPAAIITVPLPAPIAAPQVPPAPIPMPSSMPSSMPLSPPPPAPVTARPAVITAGDATKQLTAAMHARDVHACKHLLATPMPGAADSDLLAARAGCEMVSGDCDAGQRMLTSALELRGNDPSVIARIVHLSVDNTCPVTVGDLATRVHRLETQVITFKPASCEPFIEPALLAAEDPALADLPNGHATVTQVVHALGECLAREQHCDADLTMRTRAQAAGIELSPRMPPCR